MRIVALGWRNQRSDMMSSTCLFSTESPRISLPSGAKRRWRSTPSDAAAPTRIITNGASLVALNHAGWLPARGESLPASGIAGPGSDNPDFHPVLPAVCAESRRAAGNRREPGLARWRDLFVPRGYTLVVVDVRGTGASFGTRDSFLSPRERDDYARITEWVAA